jgi:hypothetical protein
VRHYNQRRTHSALGNRPPIDRVREVTGLDSYDGQYRLVRTGNSSFRFRVSLENYDLRNNKWDYTGPAWPGPSDPNNPNWPAVTRGNEGLQSYVRAVIYVRKQDASESYWWT